LGKVKSSDIARVLLHMEQLGRASTRRNAYAALRSAFDDAVVDGLLAASPVLGVKRSKATQGILSSSAHRAARRAAKNRIQRCCRRGISAQDRARATLPRMSFR
jgi:hypothetical protein